MTKVQSLDFYFNDAQIPKWLRAIMIKLVNFLQNTMINLRIKISSTTIKSIIEVFVIKRNCVARFYSFLFTTETSKCDNLKLSYTKVTLSQWKISSAFFCGRGQFYIRSARGRRFYYQTRRGLRVYRFLWRLFVPD